ncbi:F-box/kelch-repeat protein At1g57790-like isoform X2 [Andrographis paniculata]|uniref:F-box/kelch-repeat protein At1g57790-like isoform X2 n=1 Tax=Andrographis paniculata TaxID=175694 RepID=UPI0021E81CA3|nr:F-box/kelch-repeat protein At1g57790-like isoform X2 [Andrographis paniculata]
MARGPRKSNKNLKSSSTEQEQEEFYLPTDILVLILSMLSVRDISQASGVCRKWRAAAATAQNLGKVPLLLHLQKYSHQPYQFIDLSLSRQPRSLSLPRCRRESVQLPRLSVEFKGGAFSGTPKSPNCLVFTIYISEETRATISTCRPGDDTWTTVTYQSQYPLRSCVWSSIMACNGCFYCLNQTEQVAVYDPMRSTWRVFNEDAYSEGKDWVETASKWFMAEHNGDIYIVWMSFVSQPIVYKLDLTKFYWLDVTSLEGLTFFASATGSYVKDNMPRWMRDCIFFAKPNYGKKNLMCYSLLHERYYRKCFSPPDELHEAVWIDAP